MQTGCRRINTLPAAPRASQGIREFAKHAGAEHGAVSEEQVEAWLAGEPDASLPPILQEHERRPKRHHNTRPGAAEEGAFADAATAAPGGRRQLAAQPKRQQGLALERAGDKMDPEVERGSGSDSWQVHGHHSSSGGGGSSRPDEGSSKEGDEPVLNLFAFPGMDNFGGVSVCLVNAIDGRAVGRQAACMMMDRAHLVPAHGARIWTEAVTPS